MAEMIAYKWQVEVPKEKLMALDNLVEFFEASIDVAFEDDKPDTADVAVFLPLHASESFYKEELNRIVEDLDLDKNVVLEPVYPENWQQKAYEGAEPIQIGSFFVYNHTAVAVPEDKISIYIPAEMAFGTGSHATTESCLYLLEVVKAQTSLSKILDMGTGTGILAIAAYLLTEADVYGVDIDERSVEIALQNAQAHQVPLMAEAGDGFQADLSINNAPYDLIFANILKNPLLMMKEDMFAQLKAGGYAILSGFDTTQQHEVLQAYEDLGFRLIDSKVKEGWVALLLQK